MSLRGGDEPDDECITTNEASNDQQNYPRVTQTSPEGFPAQKGEVLKPKDFCGNVES